MHEICQGQDEVILPSTKSRGDLEANSDGIWYINDGFRPGNAVVGWIYIGTTSRPIIREIVGRVADSVALYADGSEKIKVRTYVRSYKHDVSLAQLGGSITRSWDNEKFEETEITEFHLREYAGTLSYSHFAADPEILFPGVKVDLIGHVVKHPSVAEAHQQPTQEFAQAIVGAKIGVK